MCLLLEHRPTTILTEDHIDDFFTRNSDGFGAMISRGDEMEIFKSLTKDPKELYEIYKEKIQGHNAILHFRMRTHGNVDLDNCHPYKVTDDIWLAHNGILSIGNKDDETKSDTWHYIENYLKPLLEKNPDLMLDSRFIEMLGAHIGSGNKFGLMRMDGKTAIVNRGAGLEHDDAWYSNTYAWTPSKFGHQYGYEKYNKYYPSQAARWNNKFRDYNGFSSAEGDDDTVGKWTTSSPIARLTGPGGSANTGSSETKKSRRERRQEYRGQTMTHSGFVRLADKLFKIMKGGEMFDIQTWVIDHPLQAKMFLSHVYKLSKTEVNQMVDKHPDEAALNILSAWRENKTLLSLVEN